MEEMQIRTAELLSHPSQNGFHHEYLKQQMLVWMKQKKNSTVIAGMQLTTVTMQIASHSGAPQKTKSTVTI